MTTERVKEDRGAEGARASAEQGQPSLKPGGIGTGVAFDWALSVQLLTDGVFFLSATFAGSDLAGKPLAMRLGMALGSVLGAAIVFTQGEALRRGRRVARIIQIVANALLVVYGLVNIPNLIQSLKAGQVGTLLVEVVLLVVSPLIVWLLTRRRTRAWFAMTTSGQARARHTGMWLVWMVVYAIIGGVAVALAGYY
jgi:hypothetical protein